MVRALLLFAASVLAPVPASAQWSGLDRQDASNRVDTHTDFLLYADLLDSGFYVRNEVYAQGGAFGLCGYARVVTSSLVLHEFDDVNAFGNMEVGLVYDMDSSLMALTLHAGLTLPTASTGSDSEVSIQGAPFGRITDLATSFVNKMALRLGGSARIPANLLYFRGDVGVDFLFGLGEEKTSATQGDAEPLGALFRANIGIGIRYRLIGGTLEYVAVAPVTSGSVDFREDVYFHTLGMSLRLWTPWVQPYVALTFPLNRDSEADNPNATSIWVVSFGLNAMLAEIR